MGQLIEHSEADTFEPLVVIRVKVLQGKEELNYWSKVRAIWRQQKAQSSTMPPLADRAPSSDGARHLRFDSPE
ncbi:hypothetical protein H4R35_002856 [Dimargaris xerosporica]|nr:hypothetical protein H4R35_002856 [Dimargaris xerosporica]